MQITEIYTRADPSVRLEALESVVPPKVRSGVVPAMRQPVKLSLPSMEDPLSKGGRIDPSWVTSEGWSGLTSQSNWISARRHMPPARQAARPLSVATPGTATSAASVSVANGGSGYTSPTVAFSGGGGSGQPSPTLVNRAIPAIRVTTPGTGYTSAPTVTITDSTGTGATGAATLTPAGPTTQVAQNGGIHGFVDYCLDSSL
jgi:hypothetical protein